MEAQAPLQSPPDSLTPDNRAHNLLVGDDVQIDPTATIGANVVIHDGVRIAAGATIKNNCVIGERPTLAGDSHATAAQGRATTIGEGATLCNGAIVLIGAQIGARTIVGDQAYLREDCSIAEDCMVGQACAVGAGASIGARTKVQSKSVILPRMIIEEDVVIGSMVGGATDNSMGREQGELGVTNVIRRGARIGSCACLLPGVEIGENALVGAGAVVRESVQAQTTVVGVPARVLAVAHG